MTTFVLQEEIKKGRVNSDYIKSKATPVTGCGVP
jgi:hypothetical protein